MGPPRWPRGARHQRRRKKTGDTLQTKGQVLSQKRIFTDGGTKSPFCHVLGPGLTGGQNGFTSFRRVEAKLLL